ncbi:hypothetical protein CC86DRAFT_412599 [Ophiobolus disseminans]|uniref:Uncharacterized protein n=1 Tax=Ophiobolus disseminans TaxID=1469910 RepID=A0A6A6ZGM6_9PLEO|nr:hypothetical protein CC86DRAFT_412599 [Ophiobolus disseminans]
MATTKRLLGVFVPTNRAPPLAKDRNKDTILIVAAPPLSKERYAELDSGEEPDYDSMSGDELKTLMRERGIDIRERCVRAHWIKALKGVSLINDRNHDFKADPTCTSFLSLPPSVRNQIYDHALFDETHAKKMFKVSYRSSINRLLLFNREYNTALCEEVMLSVLDMLGATNKQMRSEVCCFFYVMANLHLTGEQETDAYTLLPRVLTKIGPEGRVSISILHPSFGDNWNLDFDVSGHVHKFHCFVPASAERTPPPQSIAVVPTRRLR